MPQERYNELLGEKTSLIRQLNKLKEEHPDNPMINTLRERIKDLETRIEDLHRDLIDSEDIGNYAQDGMAWPGLNE